MRILAFLLPILGSAAILAVVSPNPGIAWKIPAALVVGVASAIAMSKNGRLHRISAATGLTEIVAAGLLALVLA